MEKTGTQVVQYNSLQEHVIALIIEKNSEADNTMLMNKLNMIIAKTPKIGMMQAGDISQAILKAMIPDPTLQDHDDIYFVPYGNKIDVSFSHNYLQKLAYRNGAVLLIDTNLIYEGDEVTVTEKGVTYRVDPFADNDDESFKGVMVVVKLANGEKKYGFVKKKHIDNARSASKSGNNGPWKKWYYEMAKKVAIKNTLKGIDISTEFNDAVIIDNEDTDFKRLESPKNDIASSSLDAMMREGSTILSNISEKLDSMGVIYEIKEDWVIINLVETDLTAISSMEGLQIDIIKKDSDPTKGAIKLKDAEILLN